MTDLYELLGVAKDATAAQIHAAYRKLSKKHHPDAGGDPEQYRLLKLADDILSDPDHRAQYDATGSIEGIRTQEQIMSDAISTLAGLLPAAITATATFSHIVSTDLIANMRQMLTKKRLEIVGDQSKLTSEAKNLRKFSKRITVKSGENHLSKMLDRQATAIEAAVVQAGQALEAIKVALQELERYVYEPDAEEYRTLLIRPNASPFVNYGV